MELLNKEKIFEVSYEIGNIYVFSETRAFLLSIVIREQPYENIYQMIQLLSGESDKDGYNSDVTPFINWYHHQSTNKKGLVDSFVEKYGNPIKIIGIEDAKIKL